MQVSGSLSVIIIIIIIIIIINNNNKQQQQDTKTIATTTKTHAVLEFVVVCVRPYIQVLYYFLDNSYSKFKTTTTRTSALLIAFSLDFL